jgi:hypothetical protein
MSELLSEVTPLTTGIVWLLDEKTYSGQAHFPVVDYLLNGLLTSYLQKSTFKSSQVFISSNYSKDLYVFVIKDLVEAEINSFINLVQVSMGADNHILVIDDQRNFENLRNHFDLIRSRLRLL